jgi:hypothetical protein
MPFVADTFGAFSPSARSLLKLLVNRRALRREKEESALSQAIWSGLTAATVSRAARQRLKVRSLDSPASLDTRLLDLPHPRKRTTRDWEYISDSRELDSEQMIMGIINPSQPRSSAASAAVTGEISSSTESSHDVPTSGISRSSGGE